MQLSPLFFVFAAGSLTLAIGQVLLTTAHAQPVKSVPPKSMPTLSADYRVLVKSLHAKRTAAGVEVTGQIQNTGRQTLTYTSVIAVFTDAAGQEIGRGDGYLAAGPLRPGQAAEFRACSPETPAFAGVTLRLHEAWHSVTIETPDSAVREAQTPDKRRTTVW